MTYREINTTAADWASRIDRAPLTPDEERALEDWLEISTRHRGAFIRMRAIAIHTERARALGPAFDPDKFATERGEASSHSAGGRSGRLRFLRALAASLVLAGTLGVAWYLWGQGDRYETRQGEIKVVTLEDGSVLTINTASNVQVSYTGGERRVRVVEGEALFDVAKDATRPFLVTVGTVSVRAVGTSFSVQHLKDRPAHVIVCEGVVEIEQSSLPAPVRLTANMQAELPAKANNSHVKPSAIDPDEIGRKLAWQDGRIAFEVNTLAEAAEAFARYSDTRIVIQDPAIASQQITGLFAANHPVSFARAVARTLNLRVDVTAGAVLLTQ